MRKLLTGAVLATALAVLAGCQPGAVWNAPGETNEAPKVQLSSPKDGATNVPTSAEIVFSTAGTKTVDVKLVDAGGKAVDGAMRDDGSSWLPGSQLAYSTKYTATVTATKSDGTKGEAKATFTTMAEPANLVDVTSFVGDDQVIGIGMPMIIEFGLNVPVQKRAEVQKRLFVRSDPPQEGIWNWYGNDIVHYRPREYWQPGTKLDVRIATGGLPWGVKDWYGRHDLTIHASVGEGTIMKVDNSTKKMTVTRNGKVLRTFSISLGKPSTPSSSGTMLVIDKHPNYRFDTRREIPNGYVVDVKYAMRLTWGGEFIHAAPWAGSALGHRNISHGCVNLSTADAAWLFGVVSVGDPITVTGTEVKLKWGNGWTDWNIPWDEYVKGSALPHDSSPTPSPTSS
jgi:lipoprotein-anchoring transpeptidase ErfK/SrfK